MLCLIIKYEPKRFLSRKNIPYPHRPLYQNFLSHRHLRPGSPNPNQTPVYYLRCQSYPLLTNYYFFKESLIIKIAGVGKNLFTRSRLFDEPFLPLHSCAGAVHDGLYLCLVCHRRVTRRRHGERSMRRPIVHRELRIASRHQPVNES